MKTISIVDDNEMMREFLQNYFSENYKVTTFESGQEAFNALRHTGNPDVIILDHKMNGITGFEMLKAMKGSELYKNIPVILLSGDDKSDTRIACLKAGAEDFISKPFNPMELSLKVEKALN